MKKKMRTGFSIAGFAAAILLLLQIVPVALAQDYDRDDPPTRAGRIGSVEGSVSFQPGGQGDWLQAIPNRPLTVGDNLWVDRDSRAEVQIGSTSIRLGPETSLTFLDLGNDVTQLRLSMGSVFFRVRHFDGNDAFEVDAPNLAFNVTRSGAFRLDVNENGDQTVATVWRGEAEVTGAGNSYRLGEGQQGTFSGTEQLSYDVSEIRSPDSFGRWALSRDERQDRSRSAQYVSADMTGYEDLDDYGRWRNVPEYGNVWTPAGVPGDWAPYRYGHWVYVSPWGWTWVEDEPWGFAPFHYGRWAFIQSSWCWVPGPIAVRPVYAPALVAFIGGGGFSVGVGVGGGVGWFPLGPGEVFVPWYRTSPRYVQNVNVTNTRVNVTQVTNVYNNYNSNNVTNVTYVNQRVTNSVTVVNHDTFVNARPVHGNIQRVDERQLQSARVTPAAVTSVQPARESVVGNTRPVQMRPPEQAMRREVFATRQPAVINRREEAPGAARNAAPPPVRTVRAAPPGQAEQLQRGARGMGGRPAQNEAAPSPGAPPAEGNRGVTARPGAPENRGGAVRPGAPENNPTAAPRTNPPQPENNRPGMGNGRGVPRPGAPENRAPENNRTPDNNRAPDNNRPSAAPRPNEAAPRPNAPENRPVQPDNNRPVRPDNNRAPENNRPNAAPRPNEAAPRPNAPDNRSAQPDNNRPARPDNNRSEQPAAAPRPPAANRPETAPEQPRGNPNMRPETRPQETPSVRPQQPTRPPETRQEPPQRQNENRPMTAPTPRQEPRSEPAPRPEARPAQPPPPQRESRPAEQRNERPNPPNDNKKDKDKDKEPPRFR